MNHQLIMVNTDNWSVIQESGEKFDLFVTVGYIVRGMSDEQAVELDETSAVIVGAWFIILV